MSTKAGSVEEDDEEDVVAAGLDGVDDMEEENDAELIDGNDIDEISA